MDTASAMIRPCAMSRLARMRSTSISSPCADLDHGGERARGDEQQRGEGRAIAPASRRAARSCSWTWPARMVAAKLRRDASQPRARPPRPTGLRLCGIVDEPPRPGAGRLERFADFGLHQQRDVARDLAAGAGEDGESAPRSRPAGRGGCATARPATAGRAAPASRSATSRPCSPSAASVPAAPPNCSASASLRSRCSRSRERASAAA